MGASLPVRRAPRNYTSTDHETLGSDILAVVAAIRLPEQVLGTDMVQKLRTVKPDGWYPISMLLDAMDRLFDRVGRFGLLQMGRKLFEMSHAKKFKQVARSAGDLVYGIDGMYHFANRGNGIGGWQVAIFQPGHAELVKTTPHHCVMEEGIVSEALRTLDIPSTVTQSLCMREGADYCRFVIRSPIVDEKWMGSRPAVP